MATRSRIGIQLSDGSILSSYHHWDGYPSWLGRILETHYNTKEKASELIDGGDMSSAWTNAGWQNETLPESRPLYYSERGDDCPPRLDKDMEEFFSMGEEYSYLYTSAGWLCYDMHQFDDKVAPEPVEIPEGALAC
jgi:hypothetical protein|tara:strand:- start:12 stop:419 length:408 start_codon:yes stop_codon:yes gene_type:complete